MAHYYKLAKVKIKVGLAILKINKFKYKQREI